MATDWNDIRAVAPPHRAGDKSRLPVPSAPAA
jgi:hypothetical protein